MIVSSEAQILLVSLAPSSKFDDFELSSQYEKGAREVNNIWLPGINFYCSRFLVRSSLVGLKKFWIDLDRNLGFGFGISRPRYYSITYNLYVSRKYKYVC